VAAPGEDGFGFGLCGGGCPLGLLGLLFALLAGHFDPVREGSVLKHVGHAGVVAHLAQQAFLPGLGGLVPRTLRRWRRDSPGPGRL
jgi:hypothetical protein